MIKKEHLLQIIKSQNEQLNHYDHLVSHQLKSSLRSLSALLTWVKEDCQEKIGKESSSNLKLMEEKIEKMDKFLEDILNYSEIRVNQQNNYNVDLNEMVNKIIDNLYIPKNIKVVINDILPILKTDAKSIQKLFENLITNAIKFIDKEEGLVEVSVKETKDFYTFSIKDNGMGIQKKYHEKIFNIFTKLEDLGNSSGIGLSIVKKVVEHSGGEIWLESEISKGTTFYFTIPK